MPNYHQIWNGKYETVSAGYAEFCSKVCNHDQSQKLSGRRMVKHLYKMIEKEKARAKDTQEAAQGRQG